MPPSSTPPARTLPPWLVFFGSVFIAGHLMAVGALALSAPSGPWATGFETGMSTPPQFAEAINRRITPAYLKPLKMTHNYHFPSNRPGIPGVYFEARLKDESGKELGIVKIPDPNANTWVQHRQNLLALALADDQPLPPPAGEAVPAPQQQVKTVKILEMVEGRNLQIKTVPEHLVPRDRPVSSPSEWSLLLARSYARHLCREHGAASIELIRHWREPVPPSILFMNDAPPGIMENVVTNFGEYTK